MDAMPRRPVLAMCSAASAVLFVGLLLGWARAQFGDELWVRFAGHSLVAYGADGPQAAAARGFFFRPLEETHGDTTYEGPSGLLRLLRAGSMGTASAGFAGVEVYWDVNGPVPNFRAVVVPAAYPLALAAVLPALWAARRARGRRRAAAGHCLACGYDLRATPDRCQECGAVGLRKGS
jgi:hypothetical protein